ncbi:phosphoadenylylsulfate reductase (thioredoxin) [Chitinophaga costaii]|uniref:Adenosine 5'-phosphosulfate reductase n=1 Tax=Chitinophaga costaii TaxID=1335309 RepID=A0A1C3Z5S1_9BACT|nr:phosphoadenylyl-sulfate reductase [Chitinophaga costaii]PUZ30240.1 phosphoadenylyl-sulfate reductase [Chitinophaga costaii]SCB77612.1 phosphoadenylylsulfate reductase (thioredoxin) [Chitinophaga costaii]
MTAITTTTLANKDIPAAITWLTTQFPGAVAFSTSFGQEDQVIADIIWKHQLPVRVFTLDTGRLFQETYDLIDLTRARYQQPIEIYFPETAAVETLLREKGVNSFYDSVENRKECCNIRKVVPLNRALQGVKVWITGLRAEQSENRHDMPLIEWDEHRQLYKYNPLINWTFDQMTDYLAQYRVPYNKLHDKGFISIGCAPCTRAIEPGEHPRAGRWWWELSQKECGLHA